MHNAFIVGLPRSRTCWLTAFMQHPDVFCGHDLFSVNIDASVFYEVPEQYRVAIDTNPISAKEYIKDLGAPLVVVKRCPNEVLESLCKLMGEDNRDYLSKCIAEMNNALKRAEVYADMVVDFNDMDNRLDELWSLCLPGVELTQLRKETFKHLSITGKGVNYEDFKREYELWQH